MFHCFVLVETNYYRYTGGCQCMVYAPAHLQAILLPRSIFSSNLHCSAYGKLTIQNYFLYSSKQIYFSLPIHQLPENRLWTHKLLFKRLYFRVFRESFFAQRKLQIWYEACGFAAASQNHDWKFNQIAFNPIYWPSDTGRFKWVVLRSFNFIKVRKTE